MKKFIMLAAVLMIASSSLVVQGTLCDKKQEFLKYFMSNNVTIYEQAKAVPDTLSCVSEWKQHGVCCEEWSLKKHLTRDLGDLPLFVQEMHKEMLGLNSSISILITQFKAGAIQLQQKKTLNAVEELKKAAMVKEVHRWIAEMEVFAQHITQREASFGPAQTRCGEKLNEMRSRSVCSLCSGRYAEFSINSKAIVKQEDCNSFVDSCFEAWVSMIDLMYIIAGRKRLCKEANKLKIPFDVESDMPIFDRMFKWFVRTGTLAYISHCGTPGSPSCTESSKAAICNRMLNLAKPTFLKDSLNYFSSFVRNNEKLSQLIATYEEKLSVLLKRSTLVTKSESPLMIRKNRLKLILNRLKNKQSLAAESNQKLQALENRFTVESKRDQTQSKLRLLSDAVHQLPSFNFEQFATGLQSEWNQMAYPVANQNQFSDVTTSSTTHLPSGHLPIDLGATASLLFP